MKPVRAASVALLLAGIGAVSQAAPSFHSPLKKAVKAFQEDAETPPFHYQWTLPSIIQAGLVDKEASLLLGDTYGGYRGRSFNMQQAQVTVGATDFLQLIYGQQYVLAKGRASTSRFDVADSYYAIRGVVKRPTATDPTALSLQFQVMRPDTASARIAGTTATFDGTHNNIFSVNYLDRREDQIQLQFTDSTAPAGLYAHVYSLGFGHDYQLGDFFKARVQGNLVGESYNAAAQSSNFEIRPILFGALAINATPWLAIEADVTIMPVGMPLAGGEFTGLSSFDLYSPGGIVDDLRSQFVAFGSIRAVFHGKF